MVSQEGDSFYLDGIFMMSLMKNTKAVEEKVKASSVTA